MAVKQVARRICDFCDKEANAKTCVLCHKDFCFDHGDVYRPIDHESGRNRFDFCDVCAKVLAAATRALLEKAQAGR